MYSEARLKPVCTPITTSNPSWACPIQWEFAPHGSVCPLWRIDRSCTTRPSLFRVGQTHTTFGSGVRGHTALHSDPRLVIRSSIMIYIREDRAATLRTCVRRGRCLSGSLCTLDASLVKLDSRCPFFCITDGIQMGCILHVRACIRTKGAHIQRAAYILVFVHCLSNLF